MMRTSITATEANRRFSAILRSVAEGSTFVVTSHGRPIAQIAPAEPPQRDWQERHSQFIERLRKQPVRHIGTWTRDELYEDEELEPAGRTAGSRRESGVEDES